MSELIKIKQIDWALYDFYLEVKKGNVDKHSLVEIAGYNSSLSDTLQILAPDGIYRMPKDDTSLEILSDDNTNDNTTGDGARNVEILGINKLGAEISEVVTLNGNSPVPLVNDYFRIFHAHLDASGTYATSILSSHNSEITIREAGGAGDDWVLIQESGDRGIGKSQIGAYTVPEGKTGYLISFFASVETNKYMNMFLFIREGANITTPPYKPMLIEKEFHGIQGSNPLNLLAPILKLPEFTDVGCIASIDFGKAAAAVNLQIVTVDNE